MTNICLGCNKPTLDGQALNGLLKCHWACTGKVRGVMGADEAAALEQSRVDASLRSNGLAPGMPAWDRLGGSK